LELEKRYILLQCKRKEYLFPEEKYDDMFCQEWGTKQWISVERPDKMCIRIKLGDVVNDTLMSTRSLWAMLEYAFVKLTHIIKQNLEIDLSNDWCIT